MSRKSHTTRYHGPDKDEPSAPVPFFRTLYNGVRKKYVPPGRADAGTPGTGVALQTAAGKTRSECGVQGNSTTIRPQYPGLLAPRLDTRKG